MNNKICITIGDKYGRWTVLNFSHSKTYRSKNSKSVSYVEHYNCVCECGRKGTPHRNNLLKGGSTQCKVCHDQSNSTHRMSHSAFYHKWEGLRARCNNPKDDMYVKYGGRGIKCEWVSFDEFKHDMYDKYLMFANIYGYRNTTIDRIDNDGNYCVLNCRFTDYREQANNKRSNKVILYRNTKKTMKQWCKQLNLNYHTIAQRLNSKSGIKIWTIEEAFETPSLRPRKTMI